MHHHADLMEFEKAASLRDKIKQLEEFELEVR
jgi:protein-arginine kinase activator protein McsA